MPRRRSHSRPRLGLALGSGAARGWSHVGVIEVLEQEGLTPDIICGCSMGALVGGAYAAGRLEALATWARQLSWREIVGMLDIRLTEGGVLDGGLIMDRLGALGVKGAIEDLDRPFVAIATDLATGREIWLKDGGLADAIRASISLPGIFTPCRHDDGWLVDGGLVNPVPVSACRAAGADIIVAVNLNGDLVGRRFQPTEDGESAIVARLVAQMPLALQGPASLVLPALLPTSPKAPRPSYFDVLANSINIMQDQITRTRLAGEPPHVLLTPRLASMGLMEFNRAEDAIEEGRRVAREALPTLRHFLSD